MLYPEYGITLGSPIEKLDITPDSMGKDIDQLVDFVI